MPICYRGKLGNPETAPQYLQKDLRFRHCVRNCVRGGLRSGIGGRDELSPDRPETLFIACFLGNLTGSLLDAPEPPDIPASGTTLEVQ